MRHSVLGIAAMLAVGMDLATAEPVPAPAPKGAPPRRLDIHKDSATLCASVLVFFNGAKQSACVVADVDKGEILRFRHAIGRQPVRNRAGKYDTELLKGTVEIRWRE